MYGEIICCKIFEIKPFVFYSINTEESEQTTNKIFTNLNILIVCIVTICISQYLVSSKQASKQSTKKPLQTNGMEMSVVWDSAKTNWGFLNCLYLLWLVDIFWSIRKTEKKTQHFQKSSVTVERQVRWQYRAEKKRFVWANDGMNERANESIIWRSLGWKKEMEK